MKGSEQLDELYGERWDPDRRVLEGPLSAADARARDAAGEPYAVLVGAQGGVRALIEVVRRDDHLAGWRLDERLRRTAQFRFRVLSPIRMALLEAVEWHYADPDRPEFDDAAPRCVTTFGPAGAVREPVGAPESEFRALDERERWADVPEFGDWRTLAALLRDAPPERERHRLVRPDPHERSRTARDAPWERPGGPAGRGLRPGPEIAAVWGSPARFALEPDGAGAAPTVEVEVRPAGMLRLPTGRLIVADPSWMDTHLQPYTVALPPGRHPVSLAVARFVDDPEHERVVGGRVDVRDAPVVVWEQAVRPGEDLGELGADEFFAVGVDAGTLGFFDAAALAGLAELSEVWDEPRGLWDELVAGLARDGLAELEDPETDTNLIVFPSGWGDGAYPVWVGRASDGEVAAVVADTQVLTGATLRADEG